MPVLQSRPYAVTVKDHLGDPIPIGAGNLGARVSELDADARADGNYKTTDIPRLFTFVLTPVTEDIVNRCKITFREDEYAVTSIRDDGFKRIVTAVHGTR